MLINQETYYLLLDTQQWREFRKAFIKARNNTCEICGKTLKGGLQVHHKCYRQGLRPWEYSYDDLQCLCRRCHRQLHLEQHEQNYRIPVFDADGRTREIDKELLCRYCGGEGYMEAFPHIVGGLCLHCFGTGLRFAHFYTREEADLLSDTIYHQWLAYHETKGFPEKVKFEKGRSEVRRWLLEMNDNQ